MILFRSFVTRGVYADADAFRREIKKEFSNNVGPDLVTLHAQTVTHWKEKPDFIAKLFVGFEGIGVDVIPTGKPSQLWWWHSEGVEGRTIRPRRHRQPKRYHLAKGKRRGGRGRGRRPRRAALRFVGREGVNVYRLSVYWKGITARHHPQRIASKYRPIFRRRMENACRRGVRAAQRQQ